MQIHIKFIQLIQHVLIYILIEVFTLALPEKKF